MNMPDRYTDEDMVVIAKNDEHYSSMVNDPQFYADMQMKNRQANQIINADQQANLNNADLTKAGDNAAQNATVLIPNTNVDWINKQWRPMMAWVYMSTCICDFILFPIMWSVFQAITKGSVTTPWQPLTLQGAGLYHIAMGAVLGLATFGRTREKIAGALDMDVGDGTTPAMMAPRPK